MKFNYEENVEDKKTTEFNIEVNQNFDIAENTENNNTK